MKKSFICFFLWFIGTISIDQHANAQLAAMPTNPQDARIVYDDVLSFIKAFNMLEAQSDTTEILQKHYIDQGTPGLEIFIEKYKLNAEKLGKAIQKYPEDYMAIGDKLEWLKTKEDSIRQYFKKFKQFIPTAVFPPTYYLVDIRRGIGSGSVEGQLISIEKEAKKIVDPGIQTHIIHELVHLNQLHTIGSLDKYLAIYNSEKSLLAITIREGIAEFFTELITGKYTQNKVYFYARSHEQELWEKFSEEMYGRETGDWMWKKPSNPDQPRDVGYVLGAFIVEFYYKKSSDINKTVAEILSVTDYKNFIEKSGYAKKFAP